MNTARLEAFTDGVVAIIISIMVLELHVPHGTTLAALQADVPVLLAYVLSYVNVGIFWNNHHHMLHATERVDGRVLWANLLGIVLAFVRPWVAIALYVVVATIWLVPDRRIESRPRLRAIRASGRAADAGEVERAGTGAVGRRGLHLGLPELLELQCIEARQGVALTLHRHAQRRQCDEDGRVRGQSQCSWLRQRVTAELGTPAAAAHHQVQIYDRTCGRLGVHRQLPAEGERCAVRREAERAPLHSERHLPVEHCQVPVDARKHRERTAAVDLGNAHPPLEAAEHAALRVYGDLARHAAAVLPGGRRARRRREHQDHGTENVPSMICGAGSVMS
jgi:hypothetical protein